MGRLLNVPGLSVVNVVPVASNTSNVTGQYFDTKDLDGDMILMLDAAANSGGTTTLDVKLQSADTGTGTYGDVTGGAFTQVTTSASFQTLIIPRASAKRYIKVLGTLGAGTTAVFGVKLISGKRDSINATPTGT